MAKDQYGSGSGLVAGVLAFCLAALVVSTLYVLISRIWWPPDSITAIGGTVDAQLIRTLLITGLVFFLAQLGLIYVILRYRDRGGQAVYSHGNNKLEFLWTTLTAILFIGLGLAAESAWAELRWQGAAPGALQVEVTGKQFAWSFRYAGPDGVFGRTDPTLVSDERGNPVGLDRSDPAAKDDIVTPIMAVPVNREVELILRSQDVLHSFFVRELRFKQDTVPGLPMRMHFNAAQAGLYEVVCAELCGLGHHRMRTTMQVLSAGEFENWLREQAEFQ